MPIQIAAAPIYASNFGGGDPVQWFSAHGDDPNVYAPEQLIPESDGVDTYLASIGPWWPDGNHIAPGPGYLYQIAWARFGYFAPETGMGPPVIQDLRNGEISFSIKVENLSLTPDAHLYFYFEALDPKIPAAEGQMVDYEFSAVPIETLVVDGEWVEVNLNLTTIDADWLPQDSNPNRVDLYSMSATIADALSGVINNAGIQLQIGQTIPQTPPSGTIQIKDIVLKGNPELHSWFKEHGAGSVPQVLGIDVTVSDSDNAEFAGTTLTLSYQSGGGAENQLSIRNLGSGAGEIGVNGSNVSYGGVLIGSFSGGANGTSLIVNLNGNATAAALEALIENVAYRNTSGAPQESRTINIAYDDGDGGIASILCDVKFGPADPVLVGTAGPDTLHAALLPATFMGLQGDDLLIGGVGPDIMNGGTGDDQYFITHDHTKVNELVGEGSDRILVALSYTLQPGAEVELLSTTNHGGTEAINITGNEFGQTIYGNAGDNTLNYLGDGAAADTMVGLGGNDWFFINNSNDQVIEAIGGGDDRVYTSLSYTLQGGGEVEILSTSDHSATAAINVTGNEFGQTIYGNAGDNVLNYLGNGLAADVLIGLGGNDSYFINNSNDQVFENIGGGNDRVFASLSYQLQAGAEVETLKTNDDSGTAAINITGNEFGQTIYGNAGDNILNYLGDGSAADTMIGLAGNDWYFINNANDQVFEDIGGGDDRVFAALSYTLQAGAEVEILSTNDHSGTGPIDITGNEFGQTIYGNMGNNRLNGAEGDDSLDGNLGIDTAVFAGDRAAYTLTRDGNVLTVVGPDGTDTLTRVDRLQFDDATLSIGRTANDFNSDGRSDVLFSNAGAVANSNYEWQINDRSLLSQGAIDLYDPSFTEQVIGDFNGDTYNDLIFRNPTTGGVWEWQLNGLDIIKQGAVDVADPSFDLLGAGDFNGDGKDDLIYRNDAGIVYMWQMNGLADTPQPVGPLDPVWQVQGAADFNGDGRDDLLLHYNNTANAADPANGAFLAWQMNGNSVQQTLGIERPDPSWNVLGVGDFNGDDVEDLAIRNVSNSPDNGAVWVYLLTGTVTTHGDGSKTLDILAQGPAGIADAATWDLQQIGDLNGDGKDDVLYRNDAGFFYSWDMNGTTIASEGLLQGEAQWADPNFAVINQHWQI